MELNKLHGTKQITWNLTNYMELNKLHGSTQWILCWNLGTEYNIWSCDSRNDCLNCNLGTFIKYSFMSYKPLHVSSAPLSELMRTLWSVTAAGTLHFTLPVVWGSCRVQLPCWIGPTAWIPVGAISPNSAFVTLTVSGVWYSWGHWVWSIVYRIAGYFGGH